jgi:multiple antibiotic resistance protein|tara:strand:- start:485 stop:1276 length:792 start_codon:yes stop_codon:yes gene_type:complete
MFTSEFIAVLVALFVITDPLGNVGIFLSLTPNDSHATRRSQALMANIYATIILLIFLFGGPYILDFLGVTLHAVDIGGGLIVGSIGWKLVQAKENRKVQGSAAHAEAVDSVDIAFCPLALPLIAGPGAIAVVIAAGRQAMDNGFDYWAAATAGTIGAMFISWICMREAEFILKVLGQNGMNALTRIVGFLLVCIAAQMIIIGARGAFGLKEATIKPTPSLQHSSASHVDGTYAGGMCTLSRFDSSETSMLLTTPPSFPASPSI